MFKTRVTMRRFLGHYEQCLSLAKAAKQTGVCPRLPYIWKRRTDRVGRWFQLALARAEQVGVELVRADVVEAAHKKSEPMMLAILKARDPWFMPQPKRVEHKHTEMHVQANVSSTSIQFGHFTDEEMATLDRLLKKAGIPEELLQPAPLALEGETVPQS